MLFGINSADSVVGCVLVVVVVVLPFAMSLFKFLPHWLDADNRFIILFIIVEIIFLVH